MLPRGRYAAPRELVWESQRMRLLAAVAQVVAEKGYARMAVADVIERAGVSRKTFYEHFANKEECFLAAYDAGVDELMATIDEAVQSAAPDWRAAVVAGSERYLEALAANPAFARTFLIEVLGAGPAALERRMRVHERFARRLEGIHAAARADLDELPALPPHVFRASVGAIEELVVWHLHERGAAALPELAEPVADVQLSLLVGRELAERLSAEGSPAQASREVTT